MHVTLAMKTMEMVQMHSLFVNTYKALFTGANTFQAFVLNKRNMMGSLIALNLSKSHALLDLGNGLGRVETLGAGPAAV